MNRELIYQKLFEFIQENITLAKTFSRQLKDFSEVKVNESPSIFQVQIDEDIETITNSQTKTKLYCQVYIYVKNNNNKDTIAHTILNNIIDQFIEKFNIKNQIGYGITLNDLVFSCKINGKIEYDGGILGVDALARLPIEIITKK